MRRARAILVASLVALLSAASARADGVRDPAGAEALFRSAKDAVKKNDYAAACPLFAESYRLDPAPGTLLNLADCEEHVGRIASAWAHFVELSNAWPKGDARIAYAQKRADAALQHAPRLTIRLGSSAPPGTQVWRDEVVLGDVSLGRPMPVDAGAHSVRARAPDGREARASVAIGEGESKELSIDLPPVSAGAAPAAVPAGDAPAPSTPPPSDSSSRRTRDGGTTRTLGWAALGVGGAALAVGVVGGVLTMGRASTFKSHCDSSGCDPDGLDAASSGKTWSTVSTVGFIAGALLAGAGAYLVLTSPRASVQVSASPAGALVHGSF